MNFLNVWGCDAHVRSNMADNLSSQSVNYKFVGYPKETRGYYFYVPEQHKVFVARGVVFLEREFISTKEVGDIEDLEEIQERTADGIFPRP